MIASSMNNSFNTTHNDSSLLINEGGLYDDTAVPELIMTENNQSNINSTMNTSGPSSAEEQQAVFLPTYATLPTTKLEEEPNPFEQSFETTVKQSILPSVNTMEAPHLLHNNTWDSLKSSILSRPTQTTDNTSSNTIQTTTTTSNLNTPGNVVRRPLKYELETTTFYNHTYDNPPPTANKNNMRQTKRKSSENTTRSKKQKTNKADSSEIIIEEDEEKRKNFLERNRIAALKCRQRKKQWLQNLQTKVEYLAADNEQYHLQANSLREELINLKTLLMAHKDCPISQQELKVALSRPIPGVPNLPHLLQQQHHHHHEEGEEEE